jgi:hypothetical protein
MFCERLYLFVFSFVGPAKNKILSDFKDSKKKPGNSLAIFVELIIAALVALSPPPHVVHVLFDDPCCPFAGSP